jgi:pimeloyl-ACP methyl ester carboxylesterase
VAYELSDPRFEWWKERTYPQLGELLVTDRGHIWFHDDKREGEPVLLLGGFTGGHYCWDLVRDKLIGYRTITWEPRGLGRSDYAHGPYDVTAWSADLFALLQELDVGVAHVWASGFGSYIALQFTADHPQRVASLTTCTDVWHGDPTKGYANIWPVYKSIVDNFGTTATGSRMLASLFPVPGIPWFHEWEAANIEDVLHRETVEQTVGYGLTMADVRPSLSEITTPVLVLQSDRDYVGRPIDAASEPSLRLMCKAIRDIRLRVVPHSHPGYLFTEKPDECAEIVSEFLAETTRPR